MPWSIFSPTDNQKREKAQQAAMQQVAMATGSGLGQAGGMQDPINALQNMAMSGAGMPPGQPPPGKEYKNLS